MGDKLIKTLDKSSSRNSSIFTNISQATTSQQDFFKRYLTDA